MKRISRRHFSAVAGAGIGLCTIVPRRAVAGAGETPPNEKVNIAGIGVGGQGWGDIRNWEQENIVALCDVDEERAKQAREKFNAPYYRDARKMFDEMEKKSTPCWWPRPTTRTRSTRSTP